MKNKLFLIAAVCAAVIGGATSCSPSDEHTYKLVIAGMTDTAERRESVDFTNPYFRSDLVLVVQKSDDFDSDHIYTAEELETILNGRVLVSQLGTETDRMLDIFVEKFNAIHANPVDSFTTAALQVSNGIAFAFTAEKPVAQSYINGNQDTLMMMQIEENILSANDYAALSVSIGLAKGNEEFISSVNEVLDGISNDERNELMETMVDFNFYKNEPTDNIRRKYTGKNGTIKVGLECNYPSFNWTSFTQNNYTYPIAGKAAEYAEGYDIEIAYRIAVALDMTLEVYKMEWDALLIWANQ